MKLHFSEIIFLNFGSDLSVGSSTPIDTDSSSNFNSLSVLSSPSVRCSVSLIGTDSNEITFPDEIRSTELELTSKFPFVDKTSVFSFNSSIIEDDLNDIISSSDILQTLISMLVPSAALSKSGLRSAVASNKIASNN